jgi:hypothetical protein
MGMGIMDAGYWRTIKTQYLCKPIDASSCQDDKQICVTTRSQIGTTESFLRENEELLRRYGAEDSRPV